jgi:hypothetical protein
MEIRYLLTSSTPSPPTFSATSTLERLKSELGAQASLLEYPPFHRLFTAPLRDDPQSLSFKIKFGAIQHSKPIAPAMGSSPGPPDQEPKVGTKHDIWIHMYPARRVNGPVGIQFHAYDSEDKHVGWHDENNIGKVVTGCASAFAFPAKASLGRWTKDKLVALAKWYFLRTLVEHTTESDKKKLQFGMPITPSFKDDLKAVCREFEEQATRSQTSVTPVALTVGKIGSQESDTSDLSSVSVKEDDSEPAHSISVEVNRLMSNEAGPRPTPDAVCTM